jgi:hypothetical protein
MSKTINRKELAICKRRGHEPRPDRQWQRCKWCGLWLREVITIEEREDEPPEEEQSLLHRVEKMAEDAKKKDKGRKK